MDAPQSLFSTSNTTVINHPTIHHILSGSFRSLSLFLLAFSPIHRTLSLVQTIDAFGPHQYLALNTRKDRAYTTSWALPPTLASWEIERPAVEGWRVNHVNSVPITATSSYITIPPPHTHIYSAGGPTGEVHVLNSATGGFGEKIQQILFVPEGQLESADKTRVALVCTHTCSVDPHLRLVQRYGSHGVEFSSPTAHAFIPVLGTDSIEMYMHDPLTGLLTHMYSAPSPRGPDAHDGPRHVKIHPNGKILYCVTEHTNFVDSYSINSSSLSYLSSRSLLPVNTKEISRFRGDTLLLAPSTANQPTPLTLFATTRGATTETKGWLSVFSLNTDGSFSTEEVHYETTTSGGKANAIDLLPKSTSETSEDGIWVLLTDDDDSAAEQGNGVRVLEWDGWSGGLKEVAGWPSPDEEIIPSEKRMAGGSHALWLD
ncbi:hypothetical protein BDZ94DRAFT_1158924 [Collybia nuda]|uniref:Muconate cycloisomerase 1 n=1 Tax=Collybia nuda TaxID=64659 RepID=A0A9P5YCJ1_9AGAR|nr:hypothetical protein BDZ94DRAFT_1158924 [Collybia nuda]